jgi:subtilisin-like proprotein convertase family protein
LVNGPQHVSLIVTGSNATFSILAEKSVIETCSSSNAVFNLNFKNMTFGGVSLQIGSVPAGVIATLSENNLLVNGEFTLTLSNLNSLASGEYPVSITATKGTEVKTFNLTVKVYSDQFGNMNLLFPSQNLNDVATNSTFSWQPNSNATSYRLQIASDQAFQNIVLNELVDETQFSVTGLLPSSAYYWRVLPINYCGQAPSSNPINYFKTGHVACVNNYSASNFANSTIGTGGFNEIIIPINVTEDFKIADVTVGVTINHSSVRDLKVYLEGPASIGSPIITLIDQICGNFSNVNTSIRDSHSNVVCSTTSPAISGNIKPAQSLADLNNKSALGEWKLIVNDNVENNGGQVTGFSLAFCRLDQNLGLNTIKSSDFSIYPNPTRSSLNVNLNTDFVEGSIISVIDLQGRVISNVKVNDSSTTIDVSNLQTGVYIVKIDSTKGSISKKFIKE